MKRYFDLDAEYEILLALKDELESAGVFAKTYEYTHGYYLTFGPSEKFRVAINETSLSVTTAYADQDFDASYWKLIFLTDLTVPDSVEKFMVEALKLVGG